MDPKESVVNRYLQSWDVSKVFVQDACVYPQNPGYNPTDTVGALAYWTAQAIHEQYHFFAEDHDRLDRLLRHSITEAGTIDRRVYAEFRAGLLKHISMEEKVLLPAA
jgi:hypothetical protein